jgi:hypothetical protein
MTSSIKPSVREAQALAMAENISTNFVYERIAQSTKEGAKVEIWRCGSPQDFDHAHDLVISKFGIAAFGDMDSLVFRAAGGLKLLSHPDVSGFLFGKLENPGAHKSVEMDLVRSEVRNGVVAHLDRVWMGPGAPGLPEGQICDALEALRKSPMDDPDSRGGFEELYDFVDVLRGCSSEPGWDSCFPKRGGPIGYRDFVPNHKDHPLEVAQRIEDLLGTLEEARDSINDIHRVLSEAGTNFPDVFDDFEPDSVLRPSLSTLTRLHILNIGARRIQQQLQNETASESHQAPRERGG